MTETYRWLDAENTAVLRASDGATIPADTSNADYAALVGDGVEIAPYQRWATVEAAQADLLGVIETKARALRAAVAGTDDAGKLAVYQAKYETAVKALASDSAALAALEPEAQARGETALTLAALVAQLGGQWRAAGLAIDAAYQTRKAAVLALASVAEAEAFDPDASWPF